VDLYLKILGVISHYQSCRIILFEQFNFHCFYIVCYYEAESIVANFFEQFNFHLWTSLNNSNFFSLQFAGQQWSSLWFPAWN
jgi:hypothetical protein